MRPCIRIFKRLSVRRLISVSILLSVCAMLLPLPVAFLKTTGSEKDLSQPFPCQNRPCGCQSADQCWKKCCCFTNVQKVAWAKSNNVKLPAYVLAAARDEGASLEANAPAEAVPHCERCVARKIAKPASTHAIETKPAVAMTASSNRRCEIPSVAAHAKSENSSSPKCGAVVAGNVNPPSTKTGHSHKLVPGSKWVMTVFAAQCQGQPTFWCCLPPTVLPTCAQLICGQSGPTESIVPQSERLQVCSLRPPLPPPKIG